MAQIPLTYGNLRALLDACAWAGEDGRRSVSLRMREGEQATLIPGEVTIHDHPHSGRPREIHFMVDGVKIAEIGPPDGPSEAEGADVAPGYISLLAEWDGQPVHAVAWKNRIMADNNLTPPRASIDALAQNVLKDIESYAKARWDPELMVTLVVSAQALADAVLAAHAIHEALPEAAPDEQQRALALRVARMRGQFDQAAAEVQAAADEGDISYSFYREAKETLASIRPADPDVVTPAVAGQWEAALVALRDATVAAHENGSICFDGMNRFLVAVGLDPVEDED